MFHRACSGAATETAVHVARCRLFSDRAQQNPMSSQCGSRHDLPSSIERESEFSGACLVTRPCRSRIAFVTNRGPQALLSSLARRMDVLVLQIFVRSGSGPVPDPCGKPVEVEVN